jgi:hypothetical protein
VPSGVFAISRLGFPGIDAPEELHTVVIGLSVEPVASIAALIQSGALRDETSQSDAQSIATSVLRLFVDFASSFVQRATLQASGASAEVVSVSVVNDFFRSFNRRLAIDPLFWRRSDGAGSSEQH